MGVYYYLVNHTRGKYMGHLGKRGEFCTQTICFQLGWDLSVENIEEVSEHDCYFANNESPDSALYTHIDIPDTLFPFKYAINYTKGQSYENPSIEYLTPEREVSLLSYLGWNNKDKILYMNVSQCSYEERNNPIEADIFHLDRDIHNFQQIV